jgi:hypothetical protein
LRIPHYLHLVARWTAHQVAVLLAEGPRVVFEQPLDFGALVLVYPHFICAFLFLAPLNGICILVNLVVCDRHLRFLYDLSVALLPRLVQPYGVPHSWLRGAYLAVEVGLELVRVLAHLFAGANGR